jgi:hypothetical protein
MTQKVSPPLCEHKRPLVFSCNYKAFCPICKSFWDLHALKSNFTYNQSYPFQRLHFNPDIGKNKIKTLRYWLKKNNMLVRNLSICEIGFGGGFCLSYLQKNSRRAIGIEVIKENITNAINLGIKKDHLYEFNALPDMLPDKIDLWIFQDSFEHISNPASLLDWIKKNSSIPSKIFIIAPNAESLSQKIFGRYWLHRIADHSFHWSKKGLTDFFLKRGFILVESFYPLKYVSLKTIFIHLSNIIFFYKNKKISPLTIPFNINLKFNIGEMGLIFSYTRYDQY